jgi:hypothetical protein
LAVLHEQPAGDQTVGVFAGRRERRSGVTRQFSHGPGTRSNDITHAQHLYRLTSAGDWIERVGTWIFPQRWRLLRRSGWNRADRSGKITVHPFDPATHIGPRSYISPDARLPDGRSHLDRTTDTVIALIRDRHSATAGRSRPAE